MKRRTFLTASGTALLIPSLCEANEQNRQCNRLLAIHVPLSFMPQYFFPKDKTSSCLYMDLLKDHRKKFTLFSGLSHPHVGMNHHAATSFLSGARHPGTPIFKNSVSMDQLVAQHLGNDTRFPSLSVSTSYAKNYTDLLSITPSGVGLPMNKSLSQLYSNLFVTPSAKEQAAAERNLLAGKSILDSLGGETKRLMSSVAAVDKDRLEQYFNSLREAERRIQLAKAWQNTPKPKVDYAKPEDPESPNQVIEHASIMLDLIRLALQTESTRVVTMSLNTFSTVPELPGVDSETHNLTHHGNNPQKIAQLKIIESSVIKLFAKTFQAFQEIKDGPKTLLDRTQILIGSCLGNANSHSNKNLPILLAGGGFKHREEIKHSPENNTPLCNLYVTMMQHFGMNIKKFSSSTGIIQDLT